jgi:uncharacterized protein (DUF58 family)
VTFRPGDRIAFALAWAALLTAGAAVYWPLAFAGAGAALAVVGFALAEAAVLRKVTARVSRPKVAVLSLGEAATLPVEVAHDARAPLRIALRTRWPQVLGGGSATVAGVAAPGEPLALSYQVSGIARGEAPIDPPHLAFTRFGLVDRIVEAEAPQMVRVLPNLRAVQRLHARLNALFLRGLGTRLAPRIGQGREFDRLRDYVSGDDFRQISWKASARQRKLIVRQFRVERSQDVLLCVDRGHRMAGRIGPLTRTDHAVNAAVLSAYVCNRAEDRSGMLSFSASVEKGVAQGRGAAHLAAITRFATGVAPEFLPTDYRVLGAHLRRRLRSRTLVLILTALPERGDHGDLLAALRMMVPRHLPLLLVLEDASLEAAARSLPASRADLCRTLVATELAQDRARLIRDLRHLGALVAETTPEGIGEAAVNAYLDVKRRQLL